MHAECFLPFTLRLRLFSCIAVVPRQPHPFFSLPLFHARSSLLYCARIAITFLRLKYNRKNCYKMHEEKSPYPTYHEIIWKHFHFPLASQIEKILSFAKPTECEKLSFFVVQKKNVFGVPRVVSVQRSEKRWQMVCGDARRLLVPPRKIQKRSNERCEFALVRYKTKLSFIACCSARGIRVVTNFLTNNEMLFATFVLLVRI